MKLDVGRAIKFIRQTKGMSQGDIAKQIGHSDIQTTLKYAHPEIEEQKKGVAKIEEHILGMLPN